MKARAASGPSIAAISRMSTPPANARSPAPVTITARNATSSASRAAAATKSPIIAAPIAFSLDGLSNASVAMRPAGRSSMPDVDAAGAGGAHG